MTFTQIIKKPGGVAVAVAIAMLGGCGSGSGIDAASQAATANTGNTVTDTSADGRAQTLLNQMTLAQKLDMVHGYGMPNLANQDRYRNEYDVPKEAIQTGAGFIPGIPSLGIPDTNVADSAISVAVPNARVTSLPSNVALAATWDTELSYTYGKRIAIELRELGFTTGLGGGINLTRDPRLGRQFEYMGEDPILAGEMVAQRTIATQSQKVIATIKHYAMNGYETNRFVSNSVVDEQTMRETELLGFEIGIIKGQPGNVMCSYNLVNGVYACENPQLLNQWLKKEWGFKGVVQSDWGATQSTVNAANNGLDESQPGQARPDSSVPDSLKRFFGSNYFMKPLSDAVAGLLVPAERINDMVLRRLRTMIAVGIMDSPPAKRASVISDEAGGNRDALTVAENSMVLLKNAIAAGDSAPVLPLAGGSVRRIAVIGAYADVGVLAGTGSGGSQPLTNNAVTECREVLGSLYAGCPMFLPSAPLDAIRKKFPGAVVTFASGRDAEAAARDAAAADVAIVFAAQWQNEGTDVSSLALPSPATDHSGVFNYDQDALIAQVAAKAKRTIVILETGGPVKMPWLNDVHAVFEAWYPGVQGHVALANLLAGDANPSGKLPVTFPASEADLPQKNMPTDLAPLVGLDIFPVLAEAPVKAALDAKNGAGSYDKIRSVYYNEKLMFGYKWYDANNIKPLFRFGHGLSYTTYSYSDLSAQTDGSGNVTLSFTVKNTGARAGKEIAQVYASLPAGVPGHVQPPQRLVGWSRVALEPGASKRVTVSVPKKYLSTWDAQTRHAWLLNTGTYGFRVADSSDLASTNALTTTVALSGN